MVNVTALQVQKTQKEYKKMAVITDIGKKIYDLRIKNGYTTQEALAQEISKRLNIEDGKRGSSISYKTISSWESGKTTEHIELRYLLILCDIFDCDINYLCCQSEDISEKAKITREYLNLTPQSIEFLHNNKYFDFQRFIDYLLNRDNHKLFADFFVMLFNAALSNAKVKIYNTLDPEQFSSLVGDDINGIFIDNQNRDNGFYLYNANNIMCKMIEDIHPVHILYFFNRRIINDNVSNLSKEELKDSIVNCDRNYNKLNDAYNKAENEQRKKKSKNPILY